MSRLTAEELHAVRFYIGDVTGDEPFWGDSKAYVTLNSLFFPGTSSESARAAEGKRLNPAIIADTGRLLSVVSALLSACEKCAPEKESAAWRVERFSDFELCRRLGRTVSFTSTSTAGFLSAYQDRRGIALMSFTIPPGTPSINMADALDCYAKPGEEEILLPPFLKLNIKERPLTGKESAILDCDGAPPVLSCQVECGKMELPCLSGATLPAGGATAGARVFAALNAGLTPAPEDAELYTLWKERLFCFA